ncbi:MAG: short-chain fatty acyl-CoA regulator family protein [Litoreibacter sp.]|nr:short-chain fatty acyl-CoA regulator family protein [Litoreibacter sp.]
MQSQLIGARIRDRRLQAGQRQAELAAAAEISASYLNLIEHNRRNIGGALLTRIAKALDVEPSVLRDGADAALVQDLQPLTQDVDTSQGRLEELVERFPEWATKLAAQRRQIEGLEQTLRGLNDRLTHDPVLSEKMHEVLSAVSAIRSTSAILVDTPDINAEWRNRFHANIDDESRKLADTSAEMVAHFDRLNQQGQGFVTPIEAVNSFFERRGYHIEELEHDSSAGIEELLANAPEFSSNPARELGEVALRRYARDARALPFDSFSDAVRARGCDPSLLADAFDVPLPRIFRRLASLPRTPDIPEIGLVSCDGAGAILMRKPPAGFALPRFGAACPLWPLFASLRNPGMPSRHIVQSAEGTDFDCYTLSTVKQTSRFDAPAVIEASMLLVARDGRSADGLPLGSSCRVCPREACSARREPSILGADSLRRLEG